MTSGDSRGKNVFLTRRDRTRAATVEDITATARRLLLEHRPKAASLRAIAREMKMTAPGLWGYFSCWDELLRHLIATMFRELARDKSRAMEEAAPYRRCYRRWALHHKGCPLTRRSTQACALSSCVSATRRVPRCRTALS